MFSEFFAELNLAEEKAKHADEIAKSSKTGNGAEVAMALSVFKAANVCVLRQDFLVLVGAIADAVECADAGTIERLKMKGALLAAGVGLLTKSLKDQLTSATNAKLTAQTQSEQKVTDSPAPAFDKAEFSEKTEAPMTAEALQAEPAKDIDLQFISPQRLKREDHDTMKQHGWFCNTDTRPRIKPLDFFWVGRGMLEAVPEAVQAIALRYGATIEGVNLPKRTAKTAGSADALDVPEQREIGAPDVEAPTKPSATKDSNEAGCMPIKGAGGNDNRDLAPNATTDTNSEILDLVTMAASQDLRSTQAGAKSAITS
ncbi:hypothetical protein CCR94_13810 [Rhodoblastus sphagnicola]|uniref:Uncharacterized protein n=1 Tax=Rhodoblastus sphagnicola TaxID=333368 RepID=A0A2S6N5Q7_9HYPH|nr:hypothetical protein [Rhodoblastus sphagnicola]MBB4201036.1 hypothetical protein [Rhodoblastus sphagnicola]PPQ29932.1 hypothetical protein CCR94_13810 [Rhodoblastus sphagnicola]